MGLAVCLHDMDSDSRSRFRALQPKILIFPPLIIITKQLLVKCDCFNAAFIFLLYHSVKIDKDKQLVILEEEHKVSFILLYLSNTFNNI